MTSVTTIRVLRANLKSLDDPWKEAQEIVTHDFNDVPAKHSYFVVGGRQYRVLTTRSGNDGTLELLVTPT